MRLQIEREEDKKDNKEVIASFPLLQKKVEQSDQFSGHPSHVALPPNRKARVSVRTRCQAATVSSPIVQTLLLNFSLNAKFEFDCRSMMDANGENMVRK